MRSLEIAVRPGLGTALGAVGRRGCAVGLLLAVLGVPAPASETNRTNGARPGRGFAYEHDPIPEGPWSVHIIKVDLANTNLELHTTLAKGTNYGLTTLTDQIKTLPAD